MDIETPLLTKMCEIAERHQAAAKTSGAGGGDCGIMITDKTVSDTQLIAELQANGVQILPLAVHMVTDLD